MCRCSQNEYKGFVRIRDSDLRKGINYNYICKRVHYFFVVEPIV